MLEQLSGPHLKFGAGTGRFAEALDIEWGIDPSPHDIDKTREREVAVVRVAGEDITVGRRCFGEILMVPTLCFSSDLVGVMRKIRVPMG